MKQYGSKKATEFNKGDLANIYKSAKAGELKVEKWFMNKLYDLADFYGYDDNRTVEQMERDVLKIIKAEDKQNIISEITEKWFGEYSIKFQKSLNRNHI